MKIGALLPRILATITGHTRYRPEFEWSPIWTFNLFRMYEFVFGRRDGIRAEMSSMHFREDGKEQTIYAFHSAESAIVHFECWIRGLFPRRLPFRVWIPVLQTPFGMPVFASPYLFAIAFDASSIGFNNGGNASWSHTFAGSNRMVHIGAMENAMTISSVTVNSVGATVVDTQTVSGGTFTRVSNYQLVAPTTGAQTIAVNVSASLNNYCGAISYSGVDQSSPIDAHTTNTGNSITTLTTSLTVATTNAWTSAMAGYTDVNTTTNGATAGAGTTLRVAGPIGQTTPWYALFDSNGALATGSRSLVINRADSGQITVNMISIKPFVVNGTSFFSFFDEMNTG